MDKVKCSHCGLMVLRSQGCKCSKEADDCVLYEVSDVIEVIANAIDVITDSWSE